VLQADNAGTDKDIALAIAGIVRNAGYTTWLQDEDFDHASSSNLLSCTMVITEPNKFVAEVHDRMPVILEAKDFEQWERGDTKDAAALMKPAAEYVLQKWPVSKRVNSSRAPDDDVSLIEAIETARAAV
jgi:putative SOS response-associated peptidase YedK